MLHLKQIPARLEHLNLSVSKPRELADLLVKLFDWRIRWRGPTVRGGFTIHVGNGSQYLALYRPPAGSPAQCSSLNHLGIQVADLVAAERRVQAAGFRTYNHGDYHPGRRFYFRDENTLEFEVLSYTESRTSRISCYWRSLQKGWSRLARSGIR